MKLTTSNENKIKEFKSAINDLEIVKGADIKEVLGTIDEVIIYKALAAGKDYIVEDTILNIEGEEIVDIRWKLDSLEEGSMAEWITSLAYNDGINITVYRGVVSCEVTKSKGTEGFAFDPYLIPVELTGDLSDLDINYDLQGMTLAELDKVDMKKFFSARIRALSNFKNNDFVIKVPISVIKPWTGKYQNEE